MVLKIKKLAFGDNCLNEIKFTGNISANEGFSALFDFAHFFTSDIEVTSTNNVIDLKLETKKKPPVKFVKYLCRKYQVSASIVYDNMVAEKFGKVEFNTIGEKCFEETYDLMEFLYKYDNDFFWQLMKDLSYSVDGKNEISVWLNDAKYLTPGEIEKIKQMLLKSEITGEAA